MAAKYVIYDSLYGNTEKIAKANQSSIKGSKLLHISKAKISDLQKANLLVFGSPTQGGQATSDIREFLRQDFGLRGVKFAAFDTRMDFTKYNWFIRLFIKNLRYASDQMAQILHTKGANMIRQPAGFMVEGMEGPLAEGELTKAKLWIKNKI